MKEPHEFDFDAIRPYRDQEVNDVLKRLADKTSFFVLMNYLFPDMSPNQVRESFAAIHSTYEFQKHYILRAIRKMIVDSMNGLSWEGLDALDNHKSYLFLSNHRDIILDPAVLNVLRFELGYDTTEIAIG
ncbi:MAG: glycerol acyltransferase, partial [Bacteroidota bacterium]